MSSSVGLKVLVLVATECAISIDSGPRIKGAGSYCPAVEKVKFAIKRMTESVEGSNGSKRACMQRNRRRVDGASFPDRGGARLKQNARSSHKLALSDI